MAGPLDGLDLGAPDPTKKKPPAPAADTSGPLSGIDLTAPAPPTRQDPIAAAQADLDKGGSDTSGYALQRAMSTGTLGATDYLGAGINAISRATGIDPNAPDLAMIHRQNEEFGQAHPYIAFGADLAGYGLGAGKLGIGERVAGRIGEGALARVAGSAAENALTSGISEEANTAGQANVGDLLKHAAIAGGVGAVGGAIPGQKGALADAVSPTKDLGAATESAFRPLEATHYDPSVIAPQFDAIKNGLAAKQTAGISDSLDTQIDKISRSIAAKQKAGQSVTADDLTNFQIDLNKAAQGSRDIGIAKAYDDGLDQTMASTKPLYSPLGTPAAISAQSDAARAAALKKNVSGDIDDWITDAQRSPSKVPDAVNDALTDKPQFYPGGVGDMLRQVAASKPGLASKLTGKVGGALGAAAIEGAAGYLTGNNPLTGIVSGAATGLLLGHGANQYRTANLTNKLAQARHLNAYGTSAPSGAFNQGIPVLGPMGAYVRNAGLGVSNLFGGFQ